MTRELIAVGLLSILVFGCSSEADQPSLSSESAPLRITALVPVKNSSDLPRVEGLVVDASGREWIAHQAVDLAGSENDPLDSTWVSRGPVTDLNTLSEEEAAELLKPVQIQIRPDGVWQYMAVRAVQADVDMVHAARAMAGKSWRTDHGKVVEVAKVGKDTITSLNSPIMNLPGSNLSPPVAHKPFKFVQDSLSSELLLPSLPQSIPQLHNDFVFTEDRTFVTNTVPGDYFARTAVAISKTTAYVGVGGSAQLIGTRTGLSAAHVFWNYGNHALEGMHYWAAGLVRFMGTRPTPPFLPELKTTSVYPSNVAASPGVTKPPINCMDAWVPTGWINTGDWQYDYAAVDFGPCGDLPGNIAGYTNVAVGSANEYSQSYAHIYGYDADPPQPTNPQGGVQYVVQSLIQRSGYTVYLDTTTPPANTFLNHFLATSGGASGSCLLQQIFADVGNYETLCVGNTSTSSPSYNSERRFDTTVLNFVIAYTPEY